MRKLELVPSGFPLKFYECPPGLFLFKDSVCLKSEYGNDAYCDSGEAFWGGTSDKKERAELIVQPLVAEWVEV